MENQNHFRRCAAIQTTSGWSASSILQMMLFKMRGKGRHPLWPPFTRFSNQHSSLFECFSSHSKNFSHVFNTVDLPYKKMVERIIAVWRDRQIYSKAQLDALAQCVQESSVSTPNLNSDPESPIKSSSPLDESNSPTTSPEVSKVFHA